MRYEYTFTEPCPYCHSENTSYFLNDLYTCMNCHENFYKGAKMDENKIKKNQLNFYLVQIKFLPVKNLADEEVQEKLKKQKDLRVIKDILEDYKLNVSHKMKVFIDQFMFVYSEVSEWS